jgi:hypothetical protein
MKSVLDRIEQNKDGMALDILNPKPNGLKRQYNKISSFLGLNFDSVLYTA